MPNESASITPVPQEIKIVEVERVVDRPVLMGESSLDHRHRIAMNMVYSDIKGAVALLENFDRPRSYKSVTTFATGTIDHYESFEFQNKRNCDFIACDLCHTIRRPEYLKGETFKSSEDVAFLIVPYIDIFMEVAGCPQMSLTDDTQALETISRPVSVPRVATLDPFPFALPGLETLKGRLVLTREFDKDIGEIPMTLTLSLWGYALTCKQYGIRKWSSCCDILEEKYPHLLMAVFGTTKIDREAVRAIYEDR